MSRRPKRSRRAAAGSALAARPLEDLVAEGMLIVTSALRLSAKNELILRAVRDRDDYDRDSQVRALHGAMADIAAEKRREAARLRELVSRARRRRRRATSIDDYTREDAPTLALRATIEESLADRVEQLIGSAEYADALLDEARDAAIDDLVQAAARPLTTPELDEHYAEDRPIRMELVKQDLEALTWERWV